MKFKYEVEKFFYKQQEKYFLCVSMILIYIQFAFIPLRSFFFEFTDKTSDVQLAVLLNNS